MPTISLTLDARAVLSGINLNLTLAPWHGMELQPFAVGEVILVREKTGVAIMAALNDVQGKIGKVDAGATGHGWRKDTSVWDYSSLAL